MEENFQLGLRSAIKKMVPKSHDDYKELKYSDKFYIHVWSHDEGEGYFELYVIVPHDQVEDLDLVSESHSVLSEDIEGVEELLLVLENTLYETTGEKYSLTFQLSEVVDDGVWERDASSYFSSKLTHPDYK